MKSGIYQIRNIITDKIYVGSAQNFARRWAYHRFKLRNNKHENPYLQRSWNKNGEDVFIFDVLERVNKEQLLEREQHYIDSLNVTDKLIGYNLCPIAGSQAGVKRSEESKKKYSLSKQGDKHPCWNTGKIINRYTLQGVYIDTWNSCDQAAKALGFAPTHIRECCKGKRRTAYGHTWKFKITHYND